jgi:ubiquinone/menaquinone biosynthesis C-methylase UbiE
MDNAIAKAYVPESTFGQWFLRSNTWINRVLEVALEDLCRLLDQETPHYPVIADVGCGYGNSLKKLNARFNPEKLIAIDIDPEILNQAKQNSLDHVDYLCCSDSMILLPDNSVDMIFCHQTFHHLIYQEEAITEYFRILKPGGALLLAESTKRYIHSWVIRLLFRHPMKVQKTADEYLALIRNAGFAVSERQISYPFLWWSREDFAILENWFGIKPPTKREETLINLIAHKPA